MASIFENTQGYDDARRKMAMALLMQGMDTSPIKSWTQGAARMAQALAGNIQLGRLEDEQQAGNKFLLDALKQQASPAPASIPQALSSQTVTPPVMPLEGGGSVPTPPPRPIFDRRAYTDEANDPAMAARLASITAGEVGSGASPEQQRVQAETIFNRAAARGQPLSQVTQQYTGPGSAGYYPASTFVPRTPEQVDAFRQNVLAPVLRGSDTSGATLGFPATGNASGGVAARGIANGRYSQYGQLGPETYVQQPGGAEDIAQLEATRLPPGAAPAQFTGNGSSGAPAQAPSPQANTPIPPLKLPEMVQKVLDNPKQYPSGIVSAATNMAKYLYEQQITSQRAIETELGKLRAQNSPEIVGLEATKKGSLTTAEEEAKLNPRFRAARADEAGQKKEAELKAEIAPDILLGKSQGHYLNTQAEHQAKLDVGQAQQKKTTAANAGFVGGLVNEAIKNIDAHPNYATGVIGQYTKGLERSPAGQLDAILTGIKARIGFEELNKMRAASATGGALGSVSDFENRLLSSVYGGISTGLPADVLKTRLRKLENVYNAVVHDGPEAAAKAYYAEEKAGPAGTTKSGVKWSID